MEQSEMKKQVKKSELRKLVKEHLSSFMPGIAPLGAMGNATLQDSLDKAAGVEAVSYTHLTLPTNREV